MPDPSILPSGPHFYIVGEVASLLAIIAAFAQILPAIATLMAICWYAVLIYESRTGQFLFRRKKVPPVEVKNDGD